MTTTLLTLLVYTRLALFSCAQSYDRLRVFLAFLHSQPRVWRRPIHRIKPLLVNCELNPVMEKPDLKQRQFFVFLCKSHRPRHLGKLI